MPTVLSFAGTGSLAFEPGPVLEFSGSGELTVGDGTVAATNDLRFKGTGRLRLRGHDPNAVAETATLWTLHPTTLAKVTELTHSFGRTFQRVLNDTGVASVSLQRDSAQHSAVTTGTLVRFEIEGKPRFTLRVDSVRASTRDEEEEHGQFSTFEGLGWLGEWGDSVVAPARGWGRQPSSDRRIINFVDPSYDDSTWTNAVATTTNSGQIGPGGVLLPASELRPPQRPEGFPTYYTSGSGAYWIWDRDSSGPNVPEGFVFFRRAFSLADPLRVLIVAGADDAFTAYVDGIGVLSHAGYWRGQVQWVVIDLDAGDHTIAVAAENQNAHKAGLLFTAVAIEAATGDLLFPAAINSDTDWLCLGYPTEVPGFTPHGIVDLLLGEAQARGELTDWTLTSTDAADSNGLPWPNTVNFGTEVGGDYVSMLAQLAESDMDFVADVETRELHLYAYGTAGSLTAIDLEAGDGGNIERLSVERRRAVAGAIALRWGGGWELVGTEGTTTVPLRVESMTDEDEARRLALALLDVLSVDRRSFVARVRPTTGAIPFEDFGEGDWVNCPDEDGTPESMRVQSITFTEDDGSGNLHFDVELVDRLSVEEDRLWRVVRRVASGTIGGLIESASFIAPDTRSLPDGLSGDSPTFNHPGEIATGTHDGPYRFREPTRVIGATVTCGAGSSDTVVVVKRNGTAFATITIPADATFAEFDESHPDWPQFGQQFRRLDEISVECTSAGGHTDIFVQVIGVR